MGDRINEFMVLQMPVKTCSELSGGYAATLKKATSRLRPSMTELRLALENSRHPESERLTTW